MSFGTIWGMKHLSMNLEHFCTSLSALFDMYSLNMSKVTNSTRFSFGTSCIFPKICQNKAKIQNFCLYFWLRICSQKWHKNDHKLVKNSCIYIISSVFESINMPYLIFMQRKTFWNICVHTNTKQILFFTEICQNLPQLINYSWAN